MDRARPTQPIRAATGQPLGQRQQVENAQRALPLPQVGGPAGASSPVPSPAGPPTPPNIWGPTDHPEQPIDAAPQLLPDDPVEFLRAIRMVHDSPALARLHERAVRKQARGGL